MIPAITAMLAMELVDDRESKQPAADKSKALVNRCFENAFAGLERSPIEHKTIRESI